MKALAVLALSLIGCASPSADWYGDERFTAEERVQIERGSAWLAEQAGRPAPSIAWTLDVDAQPMPHTIRRERAPWSERGLAGACSSTKTVYLDPIGLPDEGMKIEYLAGLAAHELAHCTLGFADDYHGDHVGPGVMGTFGAMQWTAFERSELERMR